MPEGTLSTYLSSNCCKTAKRESGSFLHPQGPSLRFLPQRKQTPLQSGRHRSWLSMLRTKAVVMISVRSAQPSWMPNTHSSSACSNSSSETRTAWTGICTARVNSPAQRSHTPCSVVLSSQVSSRTPAVLRTLPRARTGSDAGLQLPKTRSDRSSCVSNGRLAPGVTRIGFRSRSCSREKPVRSQSSSISRSSRLHRSASWKALKMTTEGSRLSMQKKQPPKSRWMISAVRLIPSKLR